MLRKEIENKKHKLNDKWCIWAHLQNETDWSEKGYIKITTIETIEKLVSFYKKLPLELLNKCMFFIMRDGIKPMWEDENNKNGGCISYKVLESRAETWKKLSYHLIGEDIVLESKELINGISLSPKKHYSIIKIWTKDIIKDIKILKNIEGLNKKEGIFKKYTEKEINQ